MGCLRKKKVSLRKMEENSEEHRVMVLKFSKPQ